MFFVPGEEEYRLLVKFTPSALPALSDEGNLIFPNSETAAAPLKTWPGLRFTRAITYTAEEMQELQAGSAREAPPSAGFDILSFAGLLYADVPNAAKEHLMALGLELEARPDVEYCVLEPLNPPAPPRDIAPPTPDYTARQSYLGPNPGIDCKYAWSIGIKGKGVRFSDVEFDWNFNHEDLNEQDLQFGMAKKSSQYSNHGTAVLGVIMSGHNGYGMDGCAPEAVGRVYPETYGRPAAIARAAADSKAGDVILLEMQTGGPDGNLAPSDVNTAVWDAVKKASDAGIIVVSAAGNGNANLDASSYSAYRARGDNGSIIEGAGTPDAKHDKQSFSTYGERLNVQGWGAGVSTLDYGVLKAGGSDVNQFYTTSFNGTSSAGPVVTSAVILVQSYAIQKLGKPLTPKEMRDLLIATGTPQGAGGHIGPLPNVKAAIAKLGGPVAVEEKPTGRHAPVTVAMGPAALTVNLNGAPGTTVELLELSGRRVYLEGWQACSGLCQHRISLSALREGVYFLRVQGPRFKHVEKIVHSPRTALRAGGHPQPID